MTLAVALASCGCGYALAGRGSFLPDYIQVVGIPPFENRSSFSQVEQVLTDKVRTEFIGRGKYRVVPDTQGADAVLTGEILAIGVQPVGFNEQQLASRYLFTWTMKVTFTDSQTNMVLW
ncbi:MAG TPA: LptE family protein, partial [Vicinamibacterales bacterium]|nr:LptE family protein [Vicinamibacterales bacterium]